MTRVKFCGLTRREDIEEANRLGVDYIGFVFWQKSLRYISPSFAKEFKRLLSSGIEAVGVFVDERLEKVASLLNEGIIDLAQLHGSEDEEYIKRLRTLTRGKIIKAFRVKGTRDIEMALESSADFVLLDKGMGEGALFDWSLIKDFKRPYFLAGGLSPDNVREAVLSLHPYALDVSTGIERDGKKERKKMEAFIRGVREEEKDE